MPVAQKIDTPLTPKRRRFAEIYAKTDGANGKAAAIEAGFGEASAHTMASKLLRVPSVRAEILRCNQHVELPDLDGIDDGWVLHELVELYGVELSGIFDENGSVRPLEELSPAAQRLVTSIETQTVGDNIEITKIRLVDRTRLLEHIGKHKRVRAFHEERSAEVDASLARLLDVATRKYENEAPERAIDITPPDVDGRGERNDG